MIQHQYQLSVSKSPMISARCYALRHYLPGRLDSLHVPASPYVELTTPWQALVWCLVEEGAAVRSSI